MIKFIRIVFKTKTRKDVYVELDQWRKAIAHNSILIPYNIYGHDEWQGHVFNAYDVLEAVPDDRYSQEMEMRTRVPVYNPATGKMHMLSAEQVSATDVTYQEILDNRIR